MTVIQFNLVAGPVVIFSFKLRDARVQFYAVSWYTTKIRCYLFFFPSNRLNILRLAIRPTASVDRPCRLPGNLLFAFLK